MLFPSVFSNDFTDRFFDDFFTTPKMNGSYITNTMRTDVRELDDSYQVDMQLPGYSKDDVQVEIKDGYLTVSANHQENDEEKDSKGKYIRKECYTGSCERTFYVGEHINKDNVKAQFKDGILTLTMPKEESLPKEETKQLVHIEG
jgi:HSP20 family protein